MSQDTTMHTKTSEPIKAGVVHYRESDDCVEFWQLHIKSNGSALTVFFQTEQELADVVLSLRDGFDDIRS